MVRRIRLVSGLVLLFYVGSHLVNHALGLISLEALDLGQEVFVAFWRSWFGTPLLYGALLSHIGLALFALYQRRSLKLKPLEYAQLALGFAVPFLLVEHVIGTRLLNTLYAVKDDYYYEILILWVFAPKLGVLQVILLVIAWLHGMIGLHYWLKLKPWYPRAAILFHIIAVLIPVCSVFGFVAASREIKLLSEQPQWLEDMFRAIHMPGEEAVAFAHRWTAIGRYIMGGLVVLVLLARSTRLLIERTGQRVVLSYPDGKRAELVRGMTVLEASREAGIPHASVCGGRGRCSTCRVRCGRGREHLMPPSAEERRVLERVGASEGVRLACQLRPTHSLDVVPLLPANVGPRAAWRQAAQTQGHEREICVLFADIRSFTRFAEAKLPFDVVFVLNRYFRGLGEAVQETGGQIDKFIGDGVMALFGADCDPPEACRRALAAARAMDFALERLNETLADDLPEALRIGIGIHFGPVIVGEMGYGKAISFTAIGDVVNTAARLEYETKRFGCQLIVSEALATQAGIDLSAFPRHEIEVRGRNAPIVVREIARARMLPEIETRFTRKRGRESNQSPSNS